MKKSINIFKSNIKYKELNIDIILNMLTKYRFNLNCIKWMNWINLRKSFGKNSWNWNNTRPKQIQLEFPVPSVNDTIHFYYIMVIIEINTRYLLTCRKENTVDNLDPLNTIHNKQINYKRWNIFHFHCIFISSDQKTFAYLWIEMFNDHSERCAYGTERWWWWRLG